MRTDVDQAPRRRPPAGPNAAPATRQSSLPADVATEIRKAAVRSTALRKERLVKRMDDAVRAYERGRNVEAVRLGRQVATEVPNVAAVREVVGLAAYRNGQWREARAHLEAHRELTGSTEHIPELMDTLRAMGRPKRAIELWHELRQQSPEVDVLAEARIVAAATLADQGKLNEAITVLTSSGAAKSLRNPSPRHVRQWYVLGDLYERAGDLPTAAELFERVDQHDPGAYDVVERLAAVGGPRRRRRPPRPSSGAKARSSNEGVAGKLDETEAPSTSGPD